MPVEIVQFCWKYNLGRLQNLPEVGLHDHSTKLLMLLLGSTAGRHPV
jgi:hypothetical protein